MIVCGTLRRIPRIIAAHPRHDLTQRINGIDKWYGRIDAIVRKCAQVQQQNGIANA